MAHIKNQECIRACEQCAEECEHCASACLQEQDVKMMAKCIALDRDCADICGLAARWMARGSDYAKSLCRLCAEVCRACAAECRKHKMEHCQRCADACERCAKECEAFAGSKA